jgi:transposase, IS30 family
MLKNYNHLCLEQMYQIEALFKAGRSQKSIAEQIGVHPSTICRELKRNTPKAGVGATEYRATNAQRRTSLRHLEKPKIIKLSLEVKEICRQWLENEKYSPEIISVEGRRLYGSFVSHETLYKWIWRCKHNNVIEDKKDKKLYLKLRHCKRRRRRGNRHDRRGNIPHRVFIEKRAAIVEKRYRLGDLEVDLMLGKRNQGAILISLDRSCLKVKLQKLESKHCEQIKQKLVRAYQNEQPWLRTITFDNDTAFMLHHKIAEALGVKTYFTRPYTSQDKGSVENRIGVLRRFFPKRTDLSSITAKQIKDVENKLNNRPVRKFNYKTPNQVFSEKIALMT